MIIPIKEKEPMSEERRKELLDKAEELINASDPECFDRQIKRNLNMMEDDNKLLQHADKAHMQRLIDAIDILSQID